MFAWEIREKLLEVTMKNNSLISGSPSSVNLQKFKAFIKIDPICKIQFLPDYRPHFFEEVRGLSVIGILHTLFKAENYAIASSLKHFLQNAKRKTRKIQEKRFS